MSKFLAKVIKKGAFLSGVLTGILIAATVIGILFGFNPLATTADGKKVTITVDPVIYQIEESKNEVKAACDEAFDELYFVEGDNGNSGEFVYTFKTDADVTEAVNSLKATFADWTKDGGKYQTLSLIVSVTEETVASNISKGYILRGAIAGVVFAALAFAYAAIRYNWRMGSVAGICVAAAMLLTGAIVIVTRMPATVSVLYSMMISGLATAILVFFYLNKLRAATKNNPSADAEELIVSSLALKETAIFSGVLGAALLLIGIPAGAMAAWFAASAFVGVVVATFMGLIYAPALCLPMQKVMQAKAVSTTKHGYKGAKKGTKPAVKEEVKKEAKKEAKTEEPAPAPVEKTEEAPVEAQEPAEEIAEETLADEVADFEVDVDDVDFDGVDAE